MAHSRLLTCTVEYYSPSGSLHPPTVPAWPCGRLVWSLLGIVSDALESVTSWAIQFHLNHLSTLSSHLLSLWRKSQNFCCCLGLCICLLCGWACSHVGEPREELNVHQTAHSVRGLEDKGLQAHEHQGILFLVCLLSFLTLL